VTDSYTLRVLASLIVLVSIERQSKTKGLSLAAHQTVQAVHASPPLFARRGTILSRRPRRSDLHCKQQSRSEVGTVAVRRCATYLLDTPRLRILRRCASSLEQPPTAHKTYILHGRLLKELEIFSVFMCILTVVFLGCFVCFYYFLFFLLSCSAPLCFCLIYGALILM